MLEPLTFLFLKENHLVTHLLLIQLMWFRKWLFIFDSFLILQQMTHLSFTIFICRLLWRIQGRDPGVRPPPFLLFDQTEANFFFLETSPPLRPPPTILGSEWSTSALISRSGSVTALRVNFYILFHSKTVLNAETFSFSTKSTHQFLRVAWFTKRSCIFWFKFSFFILPGNHETIFTFLMFRSTISSSSERPAYRMQ